MISIKCARGFSTQFFGQCLPKNAIYFRYGDFVVYCDDFAQFKGNDLVDIYVMNLKGKRLYFDHVIIKRQNIIGRILEREIESRNLYEVKCINVFCIKRAETLPEMRQPILQKVRMKPEAANTITDSPLEKERGSFVGSAIMREYATCVERKVSRQNFARAPYAKATERIK